MADTKNKDDQTARSDDNIEAVIASAGSVKNENTQASDGKGSSQPESANKSKLGLFLIIVLFLIVASLGGLKLTGQLQPLYESLQAQWALTSIELPSLQRPEAEQPKANAANGLQTHSQGQSTSRSQMPQARIMPKVPVIVVAKPITKAIASAPLAAVVATNDPAVTSAEVSGLLVVIDQLRTEMQQLEDSQRTLHDGLLEQQHMNTQVRLRWIADPNSRLPQMQLAWEEISLLPGLSLQQRTLAVEMQALARADVQRLAQWKAQLQKWAEALAPPLHGDILPQPEQPWLAWIVGQFQLRQAPSAEARRLADLRSRLLDVARQLSLESWPALAAWQSLHAELLLQIKAMQNDENAAAMAIETGLPVDFSAIQHDIITLRQAAQQWPTDDQPIDQRINQKNDPQREGVS